MAYKATIKGVFGVKFEVIRMVKRTRYVLRFLWTVCTLGLYTLFYVVVIVYGSVEWLCQGGLGVLVLIVIVNYYCSGIGTPFPVEVVLLCYEAVCGGSLLLTIGIIRHASRGSAWNPQSRTPLQRTKDSYAAWRADVG